MCIIVHKPAGIKLDEIVWKNCFNRNDHGAGIAYAKDGKIVIDKGYHDLDKFLAAIKAVEHLELIVHCRLMSKGEISDENCHPFPIQSKMFQKFSFAFCHNGTLNWRSTPEKSDSRHFAEDVLQPILDRDPYFFDFSIGRAMMGSYIGFSNKFCIMRLNNKTQETEVYFVNKAEGVEYDGCWFSNLSFTEEASRYANDNDRKRIVDWKPVLFVEKKYTPVVHVGFGSNHNYAARGSEDDMFEADPMKDWIHHEKFGWYNKNPNYNGDENRTIKAFNKFMGYKNEPEKTNKPEKKGDTMDKLDYLSNEEKQQARAMCMEIIQASFEDFNFKGMTTAEIASWARAELRGMVHELRDMSNMQLMNHILYGEDVEVPEVERE